ncbi:DUF3488 and transglutaminase-like domain-containing protein [Hydrogenobacter sp. T-2]|uniref:transglutaminase family protein n=1 Tax=Pampinifervens diazotrophicum TaxID=1632018 RepID=UPI002B26261B|nr:DUF3488 and transglutaminase-like domain-containing protein [Hydrogenobacter sp. T-2]WPM31257.1 DUF3488 and transglutaminase-like domain-containing protein [Hydrogenobacter sp. T-2]
MLEKYLSSSRLTTITLVRLTSLVGILSLWNVADAVYFLGFLALYFVGVPMDIKATYPVRRLFLNLFGVALTLYFLSFLSLEDLLKPFSHIVLLLLSIKSLEEKKPRDLYQILLLSLFAVSISTAYNLSLSFLFLFILHSLLAGSSLVFLNLYRTTGDKRLELSIYKHYILVSLLLFLLVAVFTLPFFFLLPRTQTPLFDLISRGSGLKTGLAESVSLGKVGEIQEDNTVVFRVYGLPQDIKDPYWRVVVFGDYVKNTWVKVKEETFQMPSGSGDMVYTLVIEPSFDNLIPALDYPYRVLGVEGLSANAYMATGNTLRLSREINRAIRVKVSSSKSLYLEEDPRDYMRIPPDISPNLKRLAEELSANAKTDMEKLRNVIQHFSKGYSYTLKLEKYEGDPLDYFVFVSKKGNCEYYASATALLLRLMGVPARVVGGYKGALWNQYGGYHIVTNSMAHVWVEAYVEGRWLRVDTTPPYVSPSLERISTLALIRDSIVSFWYSNIVGYTSEKQIRLFRNIGEGLRAELKLENLRTRAFQISQLFLFGTALYLAFFLFQRLRKTPENLYRMTRELLEREGIVSKNLLPEEIISACKGTDLYNHVKFILSIYQRYKYSPYKVYPDEIEEGYKALRKLKDIIRNSRRS